MTQQTTAPRGLRARHSDETRSELVAAARRLFSVKGYHNVGIREFAAEAGVTRGALYHHFEGKEDLFLAVLDDIQKDLQTNAARRHRSPSRPDRWTQLRQDLQIALDEMTAPEIARVLLIDAPSVLGWQRWRDHRRNTGLAAIRKAIEASIAAGLIRPCPAGDLAHMISAAFNEAALLVAFAEDSNAARATAGDALDRILAGLAQTSTD